MRRSTRPGQGVLYGRLWSGHLGHVSRRYRQHEVLERTRFQNLFPHPFISPSRPKIVSIAHDLNLITCVLRFSSFCRSRRKKYDTQKQGCTGVKEKHGSPVDASPARQCLRCDKGLHRRCERLAHCTAQQRSPDGVSKRKERYEQRAREPKASAHLRLPHSLSSFFSLRVDAAAERDARKAEKQAKKALEFGPARWLTSCF